MTIPKVSDRVLHEPTFRPSQERGNRPPGTICMLELSKDWKNVGVDQGVELSVDGAAAPAEVTFCLPDLHLDLLAFQVFEMMLADRAYSTLSSAQLHEN